MANTISTSGIQSGSVIRAEHLGRIIDALSGNTNNDVYITGSVGITGSLSLQSGSIPETGSGDSPYVLTYDLPSGDVKFAARNSTSGTSGTSGSSGTSGTAGSSGTSGSSGSSGTSGSSGSSGTSGSNGTNGTSGTSGSNGTDGTSGSSGTSGTSGERGGVTYDFDTDTTDSDPGDGNIKYNNATISSVSQIFIDNLDQNGVSQSSWYNSWSASDNTGDLGQLVIQSRDTDTITNIFSITGNPSPSSGYYIIPVSYISGDLPLNTSKLSLLFAQSGNAGTSGTSGLTVKNDGDGKVLLATGLGAEISGSSNLVYNTITETFSITGSTSFSGSVNVSGSIGVYVESFVSGAFIGDGSGLTGIPSASNADRATSASIADELSQLATASHALVAETLQSGATASFADKATSASIADNIKTGLAISASGMDITGDISVAGTASFGYLQTITGSAVIIDNEFIIVNAQLPGARFAGIQVYDSESAELSYTASLVWDSENNKWIYNNASGSTYSGGGLISGPRNTGSLGEETFPTNNTIVRGQGGDHIYDSNIIDDDSYVSIGISTQITGSLGVGTAPSGAVGSILATNDVVAFASSDERLKENIEVIPNAVEKIQQMKGVSFDWIPMEEIHVHQGHDIGVIAQDIEKVFPEVVTTRKNGYKAVKYEKLISVLIEGIKELKSEIDDLKSQLNK